MRRLLQRFFPPAGEPPAIPPTEVRSTTAQQQDAAFQERQERPRRKPDATTWDKGHGRLEYRELWVVAAEDLGAYLTEWGWQGVQQMGWIRRYRKRLSDAQWTVAEHTFVTSQADMTPDALLHHLRAHWTIENRVHYPRDVSWQEDRYHGRAIGPMLAVVRNLALTLIRQQQPEPFVPDVWSYLSAHLDEALHWLVGKLKN